MTKELDSKVSNNRNQAANKKVVLVTGCSSGVGKKLCTSLKNRGYIVIASARNTEKINDLPVDSKLMINVTNQISISHAVETIINQYGRIDILINNAGYSVRSAVEEMNMDETEEMFQVNVYGMIRMIQSVAPYMRQKRCGKIINIGSVSGKLTGCINGGYCASKHAVEAITEAARYELSGYGIQVTVLEPGAMDTDFFQTLARNSDERMHNTASPYYSFYQKDMSYRKKQKRADVAESVEQMCRIIEKKHLKVRYHISLSWIYVILVHLPSGLKEKLIEMFG